MNNVYILCRDNEFEKTICLEYVKVHELEVFKISCPENEKERELIAREVVSLAKEGKIDTFLYSMPSALGNCQSRVIDRIVKFVKAGIEIDMAYYCLPKLYDNERYLNELKPLLLKLPEAEDNGEEKREKKSRAVKTAYVVHDGSHLSGDLCNRYVQMHGLTVLRTSCPKSEKQNIAVLKEIFKEVIRGSIDTVVFSEPCVISLKSKVASEMLKHLEVGRIDTVICLFEICEIYDEETWKTEIPRLLDADDKYNRSIKGRLMKLLKR